MINPYQTSAHGGESPPAAAAGAASLRVVQALAAAIPWLRLCGVMGMVLAGILSCFGLIAAMAAAMGRFSGGTGNSTGIVLLGASMYLLAGVLCLLPAIRLWRCSGAIAAYTRTQAREDLLRALEHHRKFWRHAGGLALIGGCLALIGILSEFF